MYKQLAFEDRVKIEIGLQMWLKMRQIAELIWKSKPTVSREIKRNSVKRKYTAEKAQIKSYQKNHNKKKVAKKIVMNNELDDYVRKKLMDSWSPELISIMGEEKWFKIAWMTIRRYLETRYCYALKHELIQLRFKKYYKKRSVLKQHWKLWERTFITSREWTDDWDFEMDFIVSPHGDKECCMTFVHKKSCYRVAISLPDKTTKHVDQAIKDSIEKYCITNIITDNDVSFIHHKERWIPIFFTEPYCSRQKWLIERVNKWYRVFYPKKFKLKNVSQSELNQVTQLLNSKPMKRLWYRTPQEVYNEYLKNY